MIKLNATNDTIPFGMRGCDRTCKLINLQGLQLERQDTAFCVALFENDAAIHLFSDNGHPKKVIEALLLGNVAVLLFGPAFPKLFNLAVEFVVAGPNLQRESGADDVPLVGGNDAIENVGVAFQIPRSGSDDIACAAIGKICGLIDGSPVHIGAAIVCGVIAKTAQQVELLPPCYSCAGRFRGDKPDYSVKPVHRYLPSKKAT